jgi:hypothetical protein
MTIYSYTYKTCDDVEIECDLEYQEPDPEVGFRGCSYLISARVNGAEILGVLDQNVIAYIEEEASCCTPD